MVYNIRPKIENFSSEVRHFGGFYFLFLKVFLFPEKFYGSPKIQSISNITDYVSTL